MQKNITIVGAGLVGSMLSCYLSKRGYKVSIYERRSDMRVAGYVGGRSINLALSHRGWKALKKIGIDKVVAPIAIPMKGRVIHDVEGNTAFFPYGNEDQAIYSISRGDLNKIMVETADEFPHVDFYFDEKCTAIDFDQNTIEFEHSATGKRTTVKSDIIFGADGAYSQVRYQMQTTPQFNLHQQHEPYGYKELHIPPGENGQHLIEKNALHIWPRGNFMIIALPNTDGSFTVTLFNSFHGPNSFEELQDEKSVAEFFSKFFPDAVSLMPDFVKTFFENPTSSLVTIKCFPWKYKDTCLIGDAAHGIVPFYGQGMNCGFEDVNELDDLLTESGEDWELTLSRFEKQRKPNADAIAELALHNYIEMRDLSGREDFQLKTKIEKKLAEKFPDKFMTHYSMVTFSDLSYFEAQQRGEKQNELLEAIMRLPNIASVWDGEEVMQMAKQWLDANYK